MDELSDLTSGMTADDIKNIVIKSALKTMIANKSAVSMVEISASIKEIRESHKNSERDFIHRQSKETPMTLFEVIPTAKMFASIKAIKQSHQNSKRDFIHG